MRVRLINHTPHPEWTVANAARLCYSEDTIAAERKSDRLRPSDIAKYIDMLKNNGHLSPFEHASFTFAIDEVSRTLTHQLVRHRIASYSQKSQRYTRESLGKTYVTPPSVSNADRDDEFEAAMAACWYAYEMLIEAGVPKEDARYVLPQGWHTSIIFTMNARELLHFLELRLDKSAQWEIREMARMVALELSLVAPIIFNMVIDPMEA